MRCREHGGEGLYSWECDMCQNEKMEEKRRELMEKQHTENIVVQIEIEKLRQKSEKERMQLEKERIQIIRRSTPEICPGCNKSVLATTPRCSGCGMELQKICGNCGAENFVKANVCISCGLDKNAAEKTRMEREKEQVKELARIVEREKLEKNRKKNRDEKEKQYRLLVEVGANKTVIRKIKNTWLLFGILLSIAVLFLLLSGVAIEYLHVFDMMVVFFFLFIVFLGVSIYSITKIIRSYTKGFQKEIRENYIKTKMSEWNQNYVD
jgi:hypothetical protein